MGDGRFRFRRERSKMEHDLENETMRGRSVVQRRCK